MEALQPKPDKKDTNSKLREIFGIIIKEMLVEYKVNELSNKLSMEVV